MEIASAAPASSPGRAGPPALSTDSAPRWSEGLLRDWCYLLLGRNQFQRELCNVELKDIRCIMGIIFPLQITGLSFKRVNITEKSGFSLFFQFWELPCSCSQSRGLEVRIMACTSEKQTHCSLHRGGRIMPESKSLFIQHALQCSGRTVWLAHSTCSINRKERRKEGKRWREGGREGEKEGGKMKGEERDKWTGKNAMAEIPRPCRLSLANTSIPNMTQYLSHNFFMTHWRQRP